MERSRLNYSISGSHEPRRTPRARVGRPVEDKAYLQRDPTHSKTDSDMEIFFSRPTDIRRAKWSAASIRSLIVLHINPGCPPVRPPGSATESRKAWFPGGGSGDRRFGVCGCGLVLTRSRPHVPRPPTSDEVPTSELGTLFSSEAVASAFLEAPAPRGA